ncbi:tRNA (adenosine(37)-N6)-threonylcarbamoyltransferase complex dimerization subunit type 1 TsaB [Acetobacter sp.]|uniref:tRNA (adenosine(37)-N6)-threonylcarbamoyltransferase complex dimerization subunit type 1 TsaB n=1 Tax=Acetobacter sp. TaxID=440 RepID=UPI0025C4F3E8|nr:tRNA (adenosine(37)-N6)-threonylcarbamoyltransferase complex dimerization subunit type 1 TsaB [Acetobacter sp.]MCI1299617.1 tRNA (adenosine(37)-N6)-threonylcarbamoyltransferase complex dimerization subunit type 1 TsaB [Acetobacter sp.]
MTASHPTASHRIAVLDAAPATVQARVACVLHDESGFRVASSRNETGHDGIGNMASLLEDVLKEAGWERPDLVVVVTGPGSFTGLRTSCSLAAGLAFGYDCPVVGVTRGEALAEALSAYATEHGLDGWLCVTAARSGRWFVESAAPDSLTPGSVVAVRQDDWEIPSGCWLIAGDVVDDVLLKAPLSLKIFPVREEASMQEIAKSGLKRLEGQTAPRPALPLYVDPPEAKLPAAGLRARPE